MLEYLTQLVILQQFQGWIKKEEVNNTINTEVAASSDVQCMKLTISVNSIVLREY